MALALFIKYYLSLHVTLSKESVWHSDSQTKFQKKEIVKEFVVSHIIRDL